jgi:hypothetical protein
MWPKCVPFIAKLAVYVQTTGSWATVDVPTRRFFFVIVDTVGKLSRKACVGSVFWLEA